MVYERGQLMKEKKIPDGVDKIIVAICKDYPRRKKALEHGRAHGQTKRYFLRLNNAIETALDEECDEWVRVDMLTDIAENRGFRKTRSCYVTQRSYYDSKRRVKHALARKLHLL